MSETVRKPSRFESALDGFEANKKAAKEQGYIAELRGGAGETDFSEKGKQRLEDLHIYDQYLQGFSSDDRSPYDRGLDQLESGERESTAFNREWGDALEENAAFDERKIADEETLERQKQAEYEALRETFAKNPLLKHADMISREISRLRRKEADPETVDTDVRRLEELEGKLMERLDAYAETDNYDPAIADMLIDRGNTTARGIAEKNAYDQTHATSSREEFTPEAPVALEGTDNKQEVSVMTSENLTDHEEERIARIRHMGAAVREHMERDTPPRITVGSREEKKSTRLEHQPSEDYLLVDKENGIYGVFDGMGGQGGRPDMAAREAARGVHESLLAVAAPRTEEELLSQMRDAFAEGRRSVKERGEGGSTVATALRLAKFDDGKTYAGIAHAGDTRAFRYSKESGSYEALTSDQSRGNRVLNGFIPGFESHAPDEYMVVEIPAGTRLMLCSDGITGDWEDQFLSDTEMTEAFSQGTPDESAEKFIRLSRKNDDKTVVVVDVAR